MKRAAPILTGLKWLSGILACLALGTWIYSAFRPFAHSFGRVAIAARDGTLQIAAGSQSFSGDGDIWQLGGARIRLGPTSRWRPSTMRATLDVTTGGARPLTMRLDAGYIPLGFLAGLCGLACGALFWLTRPRPLPGHCRRCGYNLTGNRSGRCPECGTPVAGRIAALRAWLRDFLKPSMTGRRRIHPFHGN